MTSGRFIDPGALERSLGSLRSTPGNGTLTEDLSRVMNSTCALFDADGSGIMVLDDSSALSAVAATDEAGRQLELRQQETGEGPCVEAVIFDRMVSTDDLAVDARWPSLGPELAALGVRAVLGVPVHVDGVPVGSLNVYRSFAAAWDQTESAALAAHAALIESVFRSALATRHHERVTEQLQHALNHRVTIERAVGVLMARGGASAVEAFKALRHTARSGGRPVRDVAAEILADFPAES
jgi:GAF domain-containing protein